MKDVNIISLDMEFEQPCQTIIQVGVVVGNLKSGEILEEYCEHVKVDIQISDYIRKLTRIKQEDIDNGKSLIEIYQDLIRLHEDYNCFRNPLTWGGGDSQELRSALKLDDEIFLFGRRWIDVKTVYISYMFSQGKSNRSGLAKSLTKLGMQFKGSKHNAMDDARNTFLIYRELLKRIRPDRDDKD